MSAIRTDKFRIHNAQQFFEAFSEVSPSTLYMFIGRVKPWPVDTTPPAPTDTVAQEISHWHDMIGGKKVVTSNVSHVVRRVDWITATVFPRYNDEDTNLFLSDFYVVTDNFDVYKCIDNNGGVASTVKPTGTGTSIITLADGYKWKYLYTITPSEAVAFQTTDWIPVKELLADNGSDQWQVQINAIDGGMHAIEVTNGGAGYSTAPNVVISGDGTGATATATEVAGVVTKIDVTNPGTGYTRVSISFTGGGSPSVNAVARGILSPSGGHGSNALEELGSYFVMVRVRLEGDEGGELPITNDFRKIGIIRDPFNSGTTTIATATVVDQTLKLNIDVGFTGTFVPDELVTGGTSGATGTVIDWDATARILRINDENGLFLLESVSTPSGSGTVGSITARDLEINSGDILTMENRSPISRAVDQTEDIRIIVEH